MELKVLTFRKRNKGKRIGCSKKEYLWEIEIEECIYAIKLMHSLMKRK